MISLSGCVFCQRRSVWSRVAATYPGTFFSAAPHLFSQAYDAAEDANEHVCVDGALMCLVNDHRAVLAQEEVAREFSQEHTIRHEDKLAVWRGCARVSDPVRHKRRLWRKVELCTNASCCRQCGNTSRLSDRHHARVVRGAVGPAVLPEELANLRRLARARLTTDDDSRMTSDRLHDPVLLLDNRQLCTRGLDLWCTRDWHRRYALERQGGRLVRCELGAERSHSFAGRHNARASGQKWLVRPIVVDGQRCVVLDASRSSHLRRSPLAKACRLSWRWFGESLSHHALALLARALAPLV